MISMIPKFLYNPKFAKYLGIKEPKVIEKDLQVITSKSKKKKKKKSS
jgi:hypothetical protein